MKTQNLNQISQLIVSIYAERFPGDEAYVSEKIRRLSEIDLADPLVSFLWACHHFDSAGTVIFAKRLGVTVQQLSQTREVLNVVDRYDHC